MFFDEYVRAGISIYELLNGKSPDWIESKLKKEEEKLEFSYWLKNIDNLHWKDFFSEPENHEAERFLKHFWQEVLEKIAEFLDHFQSFFEAQMKCDTEKAIQFFSKIAEFLSEEDFCEVLDFILTVAEAKTQQRSKIKGIETERIRR